MGWLIPFYHTEHCALDADKNIQSNKQKEKKRGRENLTQFYLDDTGRALGGRESEGRMEDRKRKYIELKNRVRGGKGAKKCIYISIVK